MDQAFAAPLFQGLAEVVPLAGFGGIGSQLQRKAPERASKAGLGSWACGIESCGEAAVDKSVSVSADEIEFRGVGPALLGGFWIESNHAIEERGEILGSINYETSGLKAAPFALPVSLRD